MGWAGLTVEPDEPRRPRLLGRHGGGRLHRGGRERAAAPRRTGPTTRPSGASSPRPCAEVARPVAFSVAHHRHHPGAALHAPGHRGEDVRAARARRCSSRCSSRWRWRCSSSRSSRSWSLKQAPEKEFGFVRRFHARLPAPARPGGAPAADGPRHLGRACSLGAARARARSSAPSSCRRSTRGLDRDQRRAAARTPRSRARSRSRDYHGEAAAGSSPRSRRWSARPAAPRSPRTRWGRSRPTSSSC